MVSFKLFVEGGGDSKALRTACRKGFARFLEKAGQKGNMPRVVACGSRKNAYDNYCVAMQQGEPSMLLVDSEAPVANKHQKAGNTGSYDPWGHLEERQGDQWQKPGNALNTDCHLMVQCMESWFLADRSTLSKFFGQGFNSKALPPQTNNIEAIGKSQIFHSLATATKHCKTKGQYGKGEHSFELLALTDPSNVISASPWAKRFIDEAKVK